MIAASDRQSCDVDGGTERPSRPDPIRHLLAFGRHEQIRASDANPYQRDSDDGREPRQRERFGEQLAHDPAPAGAERRAHGDLALSCRGPRIDEDRDVDRHDDEQQAEHRLHHDEFPIGRILEAKEGMHVRDHVRLEVGVGGREHGRRAAAIAVSSACAAGVVTPRASRPNTKSSGPCPRPITDELRRSGTQ